MKICCIDDRGITMIEIKLCLGSSCYVKDAKAVLTQLQEWIEHSPQKDNLLLKGSFCMGHCQKGLTLTVQEKPIHGIKSENVIEIVCKSLEGE